MYGTKVHIVFCAVKQNNTSIITVWWICESNVVNIYYNVENIRTASVLSVAKKERKIFLVIFTLFYIFIANILWNVTAI